MARKARIEIEGGLCQKRIGSGYAAGLRGNITTSRAWDSTKGLVNNPAAYIQTHAYYDGSGNVIQTTDANGNSIQIDHFDNYSDGINRGTGAFPTKIFSARSSHAAQTFFSSAVLVQNT